MFDQELSPKAVDYLVAALEVNGLLGEDDKEYGE
jgi:hypothetical protein